MKITSSHGAQTIWRLWITDRKFNFRLILLQVIHLHSFTMSYLSASEYWFGHWLLILGSGFASKMKYRSGFFIMTMKLPRRDCAGVITAFYVIVLSFSLFIIIVLFFYCTYIYNIYGMQLTSKDVGMHDEVDFEFLGNREASPYILQTNVFASGLGNREERILLWFDPTMDYHNYRILWNEHQIV